MKIGTVIKLEGIKMGDTSIKGIEISFTGKYSLSEVIGIKQLGREIISELPAMVKEFGDAIIVAAEYDEKLTKATRIVDESDLDKTEETINLTESEA